MYIALLIVIVLFIFEGALSFSTPSVRRCEVGGKFVGNKYGESPISALSCSPCINMAIALPLPPPPVALPPRVSFGTLPGLFRKVTFKAAPLVVLGGLLVAVQKKALGLSKDMEGKISSYDIYSNFIYFICFESPYQVDGYKERKERHSVEQWKYGDLHSAFYSNF